MINQDLAQIFKNIADYIEMEDNPNFFRVRAFRKAAESLEGYSEDISGFNIYQLKQISGIGQALAENILEYIKTGKMEYYEQLKASSPVKLEELKKIQGMGPKRVKKLYRELGIKNVEDLKSAAEKGLISKLEGFGEKSEKSILENLKFAILNKERVRIDIALQVAESYIKYLEDNDLGIQKINYCGSLRRMKETIADIDLTVSSKDPAKTSEIFIKYPEVDKVLGHGETKSSVWLKSKIQADMRVIPVEAYGSALQYFTGSKEHNVSLRKIAIKKGYKLSEYGLFKKFSNQKVAGENEGHIYKILVKNYIEPELREDNGEIELALAGNLPKIISIDDVKGDLQMHTTHSDGAHTVDEMIEKCISLGYEFVGITDHFGSLQVANAVREDEFTEYYEDIYRAKEKYKGRIKVFIGAEINIKPKGDLDYSQKKMEKLDYVLASIHSSLEQNTELATQRYLSTLENPVIKIVGHPTGRLIQKRRGLEFDFAKVFAKASEKNVAMEINAHPMRLDLSFNLAKLAKEYGCKISINTDAHSAPELELMKYGVFVARKAGIEKENLFSISKS